MVLAHDVTRIVPGEFKGVAFRKGHIIREEDIPEFLKVGKQSVYVLNLSANRLHEDDAALRIANAISGEGLSWTEPREGKSTLVSTTKGLLKIDAKGLLQINKMGNIIVSTLKNNFPCIEDQAVAATRIIPLTISRKKIERLEAVAEKRGPIIRVLPYRKLKVGAVVTGTEVFRGLIPDGFDQQVRERIKSYGCDVAKKILVPDDVQEIAGAIRELKNDGFDLILTTGGLSVDPDDVTKEGVKRAGARIIVYGTPILPGAMFLYALLENTPILGLPACVYYHHVTILDLTLPRVLAGEQITRDDVAELGHGGLCMNCEECRYPICPFGK
jgi:molybdenum cofactor synthesis domain-containing protein